MNAEVIYNNFPEIDGAIIDSLDARLTQITVHGNERTSADFIHKQIDSSYTAVTFGGMREELLKSLQRLQQTDLFKEGIFEVDVSDDPLSPHEYVANLHLVEKRRFSGRADVSRNLGVGENIGSLSLGYRNLFGRGEKLQGTVSYGDASSTSFSVSLLKPQPFNTNGNASISFFKQFNNQAAFSSFTESNMGVAAQLSNADGAHTIGYEGVWRDIIPTRRYLTEQETASHITNNPSPSIASLCFPSVKSALKYTFSRSTSDSKSAPTRGSQIGGVFEVAGLGGDVQFIKAEGDAKYYRAINERMSLGVSFMSGILRPWSSFLPSHLATKLTHSPHPTSSPLSVPHLSDRFYLGGPLSIRGYQHASIGPHDGDDMMGGDFVAAAAAHMQVQLPGKVFEEQGIKANFFINGGNCLNLSQFNSLSSIKSGASSWYQGLRVAVGGGLVIPTSIARVEFTASVPIRKARGDDIRMFQVGIGLKFL